jgi:hypothetical protein
MTIKFLSRKGKYLATIEKVYIYQELKEIIKSTINTQSSTIKYLKPS